jgi:hypothetical protein
MRGRCIEIYSDVQKPINALGWQLEYTIVAMMSSACKLSRTSHSMLTVWLKKKAFDGLLLPCVNQTDKN